MVEVYGALFSGRRRCHSLGIQLPFDDLLAGAGLPVGGEDAVELGVELARGVVADVEQLDARLCANGGQRPGAQRGGGEELAGDPAAAGMHGVEGSVRVEGMPSKRSSSRAWCGRAPRSGHRRPNAQASRGRASRAARRSRSSMRAIAGSGPVIDNEGKRVSTCAVCQRSGSAGRALARRHPDFRAPSPAPAPRRRPHSAASSATRSADSGPSSEGFLYGVRHLY